MPSYPWSAGRDGSGFEDTALAALLAGSELPPGAAARLQPVAEVLAALNAAPAGEEMAGLAAARAEFRRTVARPGRARRPRRARPAMVSSLGAKVAAAAAVAIVGLGGLATAAYAGALPGSWQQFAHRMIGAPAPHRADSGAPADPHAAYRLCTAYLHATAGSAAQRAAAFRNLVRAAGGAGHVTAFCAAAPRPSSSPPLPHRSPRPQGRPAGRPSPHPTGPPAGRPSPHRSGRPSPHPTGPPSGRPSPHSAAQPSRR
jgi:hypothetical protein